MTKVYDLCLLVDKDGKALRKSFGNALEVYTRLSNAIKRRDKLLKRFPALKPINIRIYNPGDLIQ